MHQARQRYLQYLAAQRFDEEASGDFTVYEEKPSDFTEKELREEAAFRCWLREIDTHGYPAALPSSITLHTMANCSCHSNEAPILRIDCESYVQYCAMSEGWTNSFFPTQED